MSTTEEKRVVLRSTDDDIFRQLADKVLLTTSMLRELCGDRNERSFQACLQRLSVAGYLQRKVNPKSMTLPGQIAGEFVYWLGNEGVNYCKNMGWLPGDCRAQGDRSEMRFDHDLKVSAVHIDLEKNLHIRQWEQRRSALRKQFKAVDGRKVRMGSTSAQFTAGYIDPDAFFSLEAEGEPPSFYLEFENQRHVKHENGVSSRLKKMWNYHEYAKATGEKFYVVTILPTPEIVKNFCTQMREDGLPYRRFWFTHENYGDITGKVFCTPKDYEDARYSFVE